MAMQLIEDMTQDWNADRFRNSFSEEIHKLVEAKASAGEIAHVTQPDEGPAVAAGAEVLDLTALLKRSLEGASATPPRKDKPASVTRLAPSGKAAAKSTAAKKSPARKTAAKAAPAKTAAAKKPRRAHG